MVPDSLSRVEWLGKGPHECYPDRKYGAWLRRHHVAHASELHVPYIFPGAAPAHSGGRPRTVDTACRPADQSFGP